MVIEKVFYIEDRNILDREELKGVGYQYEAASTLGIDKPGWYVLIKADESWFEEHKESLKGMEEVENQEEIIAKFKELEEKANAGFGALF